MRTISPLRYPGGKSCLLELTAAIMRANKLEHGHYAEPFAGGCGLALSLLYGGHVAEIHINDLDPSIWAFWHSVLEHTDELVARMKETPVTIQEWHLQREVHRSLDPSDPIKLGFSAFFLNRTNRSGIIKGGGAIGGLDQTGAYKIDCRYNLEDLTRRVRRVARYRDRIHLSMLDAIEFMRSCGSLPTRSLLFIDPPYFRKGPGLYTSYYKPADHAVLADEVLKIATPWVVTYDDTPEIRSLYRSRRQLAFDIQYSLNEKKPGSELLIASKNLRLPEQLRDRQIASSALNLAA